MIDVLKFHMKILELGFLHDAPQRASIMDVDDIGRGALFVLRMPDAVYVTATNGRNDLPVSHAFSITHLNKSQPAGFEHSVHLVQAFDLIGGCQQVVKCTPQADYFVEGFIWIRNVQ